jgi:hypothetical protein
MIARRPISLSTAFVEFESASSKAGLLVNENKTKCLVCTPEKRNTFNQLHIREYKFEKTETFKCLGSLVTADNNISAEIQARLMARNRFCYALQNVLKSKNISRKAKLSVCKTIIRPVVTYGSETWTLTKKEKERKVRKNIWTSKRQRDVENKMK